MKRFFALMSEEYSESFSFPVLESIVFFFLLLTFIGFTTSSWIVTQIYILGMPAPKSSGLGVFLINDSWIMFVQILVSVTSAALIARSFGGSFENGLMRTLLSYPVGKCRLVFAKLSVSVIIVGGIVTVGIVASIPISGLFLLPIPNILGLIAGVWLSLLMVSATALMLSLFLKRESISMLFSTLAWFSLIILAAAMPNPLVSAIIRPSSALAYVGFPGTQFSIAEAFEVLIGASAVVILMLSICLIYASKFMES